MSVGAIDEAAFAELERLYAELESDLSRHSPRCELSGRCCDFKTAGHVLFATELEVEYARRNGAATQRDAISSVADPESCPFHRGGRCELRVGRPLGCRVYFCDPRFAEAMPELAERYHRRVVEIHERYSIPYHYGRFVVSIRQG